MREAPSRARRLPAAILAALLLIASCGDDDDDQPLSVDDVEFTCAFVESGGQGTRAVNCRTNQAKQLLPQQVETSYTFRPDQLTDLDDDELRRILDTFASDEFVPITDHATRSQLLERGSALGYDRATLDSRFRVPTAADVPICRYRGRAKFIPLFSCR